MPHTLVPLSAKLQGPIVVRHISAVGYSLHHQMAYLSQKGVIFKGVFVQIPFILYFIYKFNIRSLIGKITLDRSLQSTRKS